MGKCAVPGCLNARNKIHCRDKTFFKFPLKNEQLLEIWVKNIARRCFKPNKGTTICSDHFLENSYVICPFTKIRKLKQGAVPVIFQKTPTQRPNFVLLSTTIGNYPQLHEATRVFSGATPPVSVNSPSFTSSELLNSSENPDDKGEIKVPEKIIPETVNLQEQAKKIQCEQISNIQQPLGQVNSNYLNCVPVLLNNNSMILLPLSLNQAPTAISVPESQTVAETSIVINQEPVKSSNEPPQLVVKEMVSPTVNSLPSISSSSIMASPSMNSLPFISSPSIISLSTCSSSSSYGSATFPESSLTFAYPNSTNVAETSIAIKQEPVETAAAPLPDSVPPAVVSFAYPNSTTVADSSSAIKQEPAESAAAPLPDSALPGVLSFPYPNSTNVTETSSAIKQEPAESATVPIPDYILPDFACPNSTNVAETSIAIKQEPVESVDEASQLVIESMHLTEETASSSCSSSSTSCSSAPFPQYVLPFASPDSTDANKTPAAHSPKKPTKKRTIFINGAQPDAIGATSDTAQAKLRRHTKPSIPSKLHPPADTSKKSTECTSKTSQSDLCWRTLMSMTSKRNSELPPTTGTSKRSTRPTFILPKSGKNAATETLLSLLVASKSNPSLMSMTSKNYEIDTPSGTSKKSAKVSIVRLENDEEAAREALQSLSDGSEGNPSLMSMTSNKDCEQKRPSETSKKSAGSSIELTENGENVTREILQSLPDGSESNPLFGPRTTERPGDLFDVFADLIADKLRRMDLDDCAHALRGIVNIVNKIG